MEKVYRDMYSVEVINEIVENIENMQYSTGRRLRSCTAKIYDVYEGDSIRYTVLYSYYTLVAYYDHESGVFCDILRPVYGYTNTSAQHISKFKKDLPYYIKRDIRFM